MGIKQLEPRAAAPTRLPLVPLSATTPDLLQKILTPGYVGTVMLDNTILPEAAEIGKGRLAAGEKGHHRGSNSTQDYNPHKDTKGAAGELVMAGLLHNEIVAGRVERSVFVADVPDKRPDLRFNRLAGDIKTNGKMAAFPGYADRDDKFLAANEDKVAEYCARGLDYLVFVYFESLLVAHICTFDVKEVAKWSVLSLPGKTPFKFKVAAGEVPLGLSGLPV